ncbi:MAG: GNAT family N-acetyltransferase [Anaerofustis stercorihominis]|nr:GNAT family N-acetyltransferase [Anaerofustis stercorihominis]
MNIRRAETKDMERINDLLYQVELVHHNGRPDIFKCGAKKYTDEELTAIINNDNTPIFVYEDDNGIVQGYAFCIFQQYVNSNLMTDIKTLYIDDLCVDENVRGQKIGTKLYNHVVDFAKEQGFYNVTLNVWELNQSAKKFYESLGLKVQKTYMENIL